MKDSLYLRKLPEIKLHAIAFGVSQALGFEKVLYSKTRTGRGMGY